MPEPSNRGVHFPEQQHRQPEQGTLAGVKDKAQDLASSVAGSAQQAWDSTRDQVENAASYVGGTAEEAFDNVTSFVRRYPLACVLGGFFVGYFAACAMGGMPQMHDRLRQSSSYS